MFGHLETPVGHLIEKTETSQSDAIGETPVKNPIRRESAIFASKNERLKFLDAYEPIGPCDCRKVFGIVE